VRASPSAKRSRELLATDFLGKPQDGCGRKQAVWVEFTRWLFGGLGGQHKNIKKMGDCFEYFCFFKRHEYEYLTENRETNKKF
jgi:hypothetical protein